MVVSVCKSFLGLKGSIWSFFQHFIFWICRFSLKVWIENSEEEEFPNQCEDPPGAANGSWINRSKCSGSPREVLTVDTDLNQAVASEESESATSENYLKPASERSLQKIKCLFCSLSCSSFGAKCATSSALFSAPCSVCETCKTLWMHNALCHNSQGNTAG